MYIFPDVDECEQPEICHHGCENEIGSFKCLCNDGYYIADVTGTCKGIFCRFFGMIPLLQQTKYDKKVLPIITQLEQTNHNYFPDLNNWK